MPSKRILQVQPVAAYDDNYIWLLSDGHCAVVVDPGDAQPVIAHLKEHNLVLQAILITHHHADHVGGIADLLNWANANQPVVPVVYGPALEDIPQVTEPLMQGDTLHIAPFVSEFWVLGVPGHTAGHIAYFLNNGSTQHLFCGDTLFASGCGRLFEGYRDKPYKCSARIWTVGYGHAMYADQLSLPNARVGNYQGMIRDEYPLKPQDNRVWSKSELEDLFKADLVSFERGVLRLAPILDGNQAKFDAVVCSSYRDWETDRKSTRLNSSHRL